MVEYRTSAQAVFDIKYHLVWITKYRYKILRGRIAERARLQLRQICQARETVINTRCGGSRSDPHAGVGAAGYGASQVGAVSERAVIAEAPTRNSGTAQSATGGSTCGRGGEETIKKYIENHNWDEKDQGFKSTEPNRALSRLLAESPSGGFSRNPDFQSELNSTGFSR